jgi:hypothetical protein
VRSRLGFVILVAAVALPPDISSGGGLGELPSINADGGVVDAGAADGEATVSDSTTVGGATCDTDTNPVSADSCPGDNSQPPAQTGDQYWIGGPPGFPCCLSCGDKHRGVDVVFQPGQEQWLAGRFTYGTADCELHGETVEVWIRTSCGTWENFGSGLSSENGTGITFHGIEDNGGWLFFTIPAAKRLGPGSYPVTMIVKGDGTKARFWLHVWRAGTSAVVTDIDGTVTTAEHDGLWSNLDPASPDARSNATELFDAYQSKGYRVVYLTARPEFLTRGTAAWLASEGFPIDVLHTSHFGETGDTAVNYKKNFLLSLMQDAGVVVDWAYGNLESDLLAYLGAGVMASHIYLFEGEYSGDLLGSNMISDFAPEVDRVNCLPPVNERAAIFADGFESGDTSAWSTSVP